MVEAQQWLIKEYSNQPQTTQIIFDGKILLEGDLVIENFPKLETIAMPDCDDPERLSTLPKVQIRNCPQLKQVKIALFSVENFSISNCPQIETLNLEHNSLTSLKISELTKLVDLNCLGNDSLTALDISNNLKLKRLECDDSLKAKISWKDELLRWRVSTEWESFKNRVRGRWEEKLFQKKELDTISKEANRQEPNPNWKSRFDTLKNLINKSFPDFGTPSSGNGPTIEEVE